MGFHSLVNCSNTFPACDIPLTAKSTTHTQASLTPRAARCRSSRPGSCRLGCSWRPRRRGPTWSGPWPPPPGACSATPPARSGLKRDRHRGVRSRESGEVDQAADQVWFVKGAQSYGVVYEDDKKSTSVNKKAALIFECCCIRR